MFNKEDCPHILPCGYCDKKGAKCTALNKDRRCDTCKFYEATPIMTLCRHDKHISFVPSFTVCDDWCEKEYLI